jgi:hypothetical protein
MSIFVSDIFFTILLAFGVHIFLVKEIKLSVKFGMMDHRDNIQNPLAKKSTVLTGKRAQTFGISLVLIATLCLVFFKFGDVAFSV